MKKSFLIGFPLAMLTLIGCGPKPEQLDATATQIAARIYATQTASVPTTTTTPTLTLTPIPTATLTSTPMPDASVLADSLAVYEGPDIIFAYIADAYRGEALEVLGKYQGCDWLKIRTPAGVEGWIRAPAAFVQLNLICEELPVGTFRPYTGSIVLDHRATRGKGELTIDNGSPTDSLVLLANKSNLPIVACYVRASTQFTLTGIPDGEIKIFFSSGSAWDGEALRFTIDVNYYSFEEPFTYKTTANQYMVGSITLHPVVGGTAHTNPIQPDEFPPMND
jgi:hypothetical protein